MKTPRYHIRIPAAQIERVDNLLIKTGKFANRSEAARSGLNLLCDLEERKKLNSSSINKVEE